jgi:8-oxo-dGTP diphosphatase
VPLVGGALLVARRAEGTHQGGTWEFPGGKLAPDETPADGARRELYEETGLEAAELEPLVVVVHEYAEYAVRLHVFLARDPAGEPRIDGGRAWAWKPFDEMQELKMPPANAQILRALRWRLD